ncbi:uncharacterized protein ACA1_266760 [Acanthamoeba castellanii str. Neff]|uniref:Uncharacterized protein n=1 Tax=Acanthamoeba castellanii (strain ATCC 30010 / Neff) TaxID=1257118 RepID=L8H1N0_ACACF|nr:uncharacterized protein ACA1_266760 [Acanthamoeba castellanii str. Neff]ELR19419.1 hypothetical protein ACA1_266760 [Acanthamoeba castellanii str. Neff]
MSGWLVYDTVKTVRIEDRKLSALYYALVLGALAYTASTIVYHKGYLEYEPHIVGGLALHLTRQHHGSEAGHPPDLIDTRLLPYCRQSSHSARDAKPCLIWDDDDILVQRGTHAALITTRVQRYLEKRVCGPTEVSCGAIWEEVSHDDYYIADTENFELGVYHSMQAPHFFEESGHSHAFAEGNLHMKGVLMKYNNIRCDGKLKCAFGQGDISYRYRIYRVPESNSEMVEVKKLNDTHRVRSVKQGIQVLIVNLCSGLGMMAIATVVVDAIAIYVLPKKTTYFSHKYKVVDKIRLSDKAKTASGGDDAASSPSASENSGKQKTSAGETTKRKSKKSSEAAVDSKPAGEEQEGEGEGKGQLRQRKPKTARHADE